MIDIDSTGKASVGIRIITGMKEKDGDNDTSGTI